MMREPMRISESRAEKLEKFVVKRQAFRKRLRGDAHVYLD